VRTSFGLDASLAGGIALFVLAGSAGISVLLTQRLSARTLMLYGPSVLLAGVGLALASLSYTRQRRSSSDSACRERLRHGLPRRDQDGSAARCASRACGVLSVIFVISYLAMGLPAVVAAISSHVGRSFLDLRASLAQSSWCSLRSLS